MSDELEETPEPVTEVQGLPDVIQPVAGDKRLNVFQSIQALQVLPHYHPFLKQKPKDFSFENPTINPVQMASAMQAKMESMGAWGLSANTLGLDIRMFVAGYKGEAVACFNPKIIGYSTDVTLMEESDVVLPDLVLALRRPAAVAVSYFDMDGTEVVTELEGMAARIFQHEMDYMNGTNFTTLASRFKLERAMLHLKNKSQKRLRNYVKEMHKKSEISLPAPEDS